MPLKILPFFVEKPSSYFKCTVLGPSSSFIEYFSIAVTLQNPHENMISGVSSNPFIYYRVTFTHKTCSFQLGYALTWRMALPTVTVNSNGLRHAAFHKCGDKFDKKRKTLIEQFLCP